MFRRLLTAAVAACTLASVPAFAGNYGHQYKKITTYETVVHYETRREAYQVQVTHYNAYHQPYTVTETRYRHVQVPVKKVVPVVKWVKVGH